MNAKALLCFTGLLIASPAAADDALAELTPSHRLAGVRADRTAVTPADVLADADLSPADGILLEPSHFEEALLTGEWTAVARAARSLAVPLPSGFVGGRRSLSFSTSLMMSAIL